MGLLRRSNDHGTLRGGADAGAGGRTRTVEAATRCARVRARRRCSGALAGALLVAATTAMAAQGYPERPVRFVVGFSPGGSNDLVARVLGARLTEQLGQQVVIDNRAGAGGTIANDLVSRATPDGHTMLLVPASFSYEGALHRKLPYERERDFIPVSLVATAPFVLLGNMELPAKGVTELVAYARQYPGKVNAGHAGVGNFTHLTLELFRLSTGIKWTYISYKGSGPGLQALIAGETHVSSAAMPPSYPHVKAGRVRALAVTSGERAPLLPDVATVAEAGVQGYEAVGWWGVVVPAGTPEAVVSALGEHVARAARADAVSKPLAKVGAQVRGSSPQAFEAFIAKEHAKWTKVIRDAGLKAR